MYLKICSFSTIKHIKSKLCYIFVFSTHPVSSRVLSMCQSGKFSPWRKRDVEGGGKKDLGGQRGEKKWNRWQSSPSDGGRIISATFQGKKDPISSCAGHGTGWLKWDMN